MADTVKPDDQDKQLKPIEPSRAIETELLLLFFKVLRAGYIGAAARILRAARADKASVGNGETPSLLEVTLEQLRRHFTLAVANAAPAIANLFREEEQRHRARFVSSIRAELGGIDIKPVLSAADIAPQIRLATSQNVALIRGISEGVASRIETRMFQHIATGARNTELEKTLTEAFGFGRKRAKLVARDQTASFNGNLNRIRQTQAGITHYVWSTSQDERVRPEHQAREGKEYRWDKPPADGHPGEPINCRCVAIPVIKAD